LICSAVDPDMVLILSGKVPLVKVQGKGKAVSRSCPIAPPAVPAAPFNY
jgi:hypothetical protein